MGSAVVESITRGYCEKLYYNKFDNADEINQSFERDRVLKLTQEEAEHMNCQT